jgi:hypothetical protein
MTPWQRRAAAAVIALLGGLGIVVSVDTVRDLPAEQGAFTERVLCDVPPGQCADLVKRTVRDVDGGPAERGDCDDYDESQLRWSEKLWCLEATTSQRGAIRAWYASPNTMQPLADGGIPDADGCWVHLQFTQAMVKLVGDRLTVGTSDSCLLCTSLDCLPAKVLSQDGANIAHRFGSSSLFDPQPDAGPDGGP